MTLLFQPRSADNVDALASAIRAWCAKRDIAVNSQAGLSVASKAIDLYHAGYLTHDQLMGGLHHLA